MKLSDIELKELSQLVYLDIPKKLHENLIRYGELDFGDFINHYKNNLQIFETKFGEKEKLYYKSLLDKYSEPKYKDVVIKGYVNSNKTGSGYASLALDTGNGNIAIVNRGSESPGSDVEGDLTLGDSITQQWKDWIDNAETAGKITAQQKKSFEVYLEIS